jgi:hypothetical protein
VTAKELVDSICVYRGGYIAEVVIFAISLMDYAVLFVTFHSGLGFSMRFGI